MTKNILFGCAAALAVISAGCNMSQQKQDFSRVTEDFVYSTLALSPVSATSAGYHEHRGAALDEMLDDYSAQGIQQQRTMFQGFRDRLNGAKPETLSAEDRADYEVLQNQIALAFLDLDKIQSY